MSKMNINGLDPSAMLAMRELQKKREAGEEIDPQTAEALDAIQLASSMIDSVMSGRHIDVAFFKILSDSTSKRLNVEAKVKSAPVHSKRERRRMTTIKSRKR